MRIFVLTELLRCSNIRNLQIHLILSDFPMFVGAIYTVEQYFFIQLPNSCDFELSLTQIDNSRKGIIVYNCYANFKVTIGKK